MRNSAMRKVFSLVLCLCLLMQLVPVHMHAQTGTELAGGDPRLVCDGEHARPEASQYTNNGDTHTFTCTACGDTVTEPHTVDENGKCPCGAELSMECIVTDGEITLTANGAVRLQEAVTIILASGRRTFTVVLPAHAPAGMITAIRRAICDNEDVEDGSIHLTLEGVTTIPDNHSDGIAFGTRDGERDDETGEEIIPNECVTQLASIHLPDVTHIGANAFYGCSNLASVTAPKVQTIGTFAFADTALTSVEFPELTTIPNSMLSGTHTLSSAKFPKVTTVEDNGLLIGNESIPEHNSTPFSLELTAAGDITFNGSEHFDIASQNYSTEIELKLCCDKEDEVTRNADGTATWKVREDLSYTFKSITFTEHSYVDGVCEVCGEACDNHVMSADDGLCDHCNSMVAVAAVEANGEETYYDDLTTAVTEWLYRNHRTLTLLQDVKSDTDIQSQYAQSSTLDLNGHTLEFTGNHCLRVSASGADGESGLTILDSSEAGTGQIIAGGNNETLINSGTTTLLSGTIRHTGEKAAVMAYNETPFVLDGGKLVSASTYALNIYGGQRSLAVIKSGTLEGVGAHVGIDRGTLDLTQLKDVDIADGWIVINDSWSLDENYIGLNLPKGASFEDKAQNPLTPEQDATYDRVRYQLTVGAIGTIRIHDHVYEPRFDNTHHWSACECGEMNPEVEKEEHRIEYEIVGDQHVKYCAFNVEKGCDYEVTEPHRLNAEGKCECSGDHVLAEATVTMNDGTPVGYSTLAEAIREVETAAAEDKAVVTLLKDVELSEGLWITGGVFTLDLNGKTLSGGSECLSMEGSSTAVTITDSGTTGTIIAEKEDTISVMGIDTLTIEDGTIKAPNGTGISVYDGNLTIEGGKIMAQNGIGVSVSDGDLTIEGGIITTQDGTGVSVYNGNLTIEDGTITAKGNGSAGVYMARGVLTIEGGRIEAAGCGVWQSSGTLHITDGEIIADSTGVFVEYSSDSTISGGTIKGESNGVYATNGGQVIITGGTISCSTTAAAGDACDLYATDGSIKLGYGENDTGAYFPNGVIVWGSTLEQLLDEDAAYWQGGKMISLNGNQDIITGEVTVRKACAHIPDANGCTDNYNGTHSFTCSVCTGSVTKAHSPTYSSFMGVAIEAVCSDGCGAEGYAEIRTDNKPYDGQPYAAEVEYWGSWPGEEPVITYMQGQSALSKAPTNVGNYTACMSVGGVTVTSDFRIIEAEPDFTLPTGKTGLVYTGEPQQLLEKAGSSTGGTMMYSLDRVKWHDDLTQITNVTGKAGDWKVYFSVRGDSNHADLGSEDHYITVTVAPATVTVTADAKSKTYGADNPALTYRVSGLIGNDTLTGALETAATKTSDVGAYDITVGTLANSNYTIDFVGAKLTIEKAAAPAIVWPTAAELTYGQKLSDSALTGGDANGTFAWQDGDTVPTVFNSGYTVVYTPNDTKNYDYTGVTLTNTVSVTVNQAAASIETAPEAQELTYTGSAQELIRAGSIKGGTMRYSLSENGSYSAAIPTGTDAGDYTVWYYARGDANHTDSAKGSVHVTIAKAKAEINVDTTPITVTYGDTVTLPTATSSFGTVACDTTAAELKNAGIYTVTYTVAGNHNYDGSVKTVTVIVTPKELTITGATIGSVQFDKDGGYALTVIGVTLDGVVQGDTLTMGADYTAAAAWTGNNQLGEQTALVSVTMSNKNYQTPAAFETKVMITCVHSYTAGDYVWDEEHTACTVMGTCEKGCGTTEQATAVVTAEETKAPTCLEMGETTYTAEFTETWAQTQTKTVEDIPALNHDWKETVYDWSVDGKTCTATRVCERDAAHKETETATLDNGITAEVTKNPTTTAMGETTYTAVFEADWAKKQTTTRADVPMLNEVKLPERPQGGSVSVDNTTPANGEEVVVTVTPDKGQEVVDVVVKDENGDEVPVTKKDDGSYAYTQPEGSDVTIDVEFKASQYEVTIPEIVGGEVTTDNESPKMDDEVTITVEPDAGREVEEVKVTDENGEELDVTDNGDGTYTYTQPAGDVTVEVEIKKTVYDNEIVQPSGGKVETDPAAPTMGETVTIKVTPDGGKAIVKITVTDENGEEVEVFDRGNGVYSYVQPAGKVKISVTLRTTHVPNYDAEESEPADETKDDGWRVLCRKLNVRAGAGTQYAIIGSLSRGECVKGEWLDNGWVKILLEDGTIGYISGSYVEECDHDTAAIPETAAVLCRKLNVRAGAGTQYKRIGQLSRGEIVTIVDCCNGWYKIVYQDGYGWISSKYVG